MITIKNFKKIKEKLAILSTFPDLPFAKDLTGEDYIEIYKIFEKIENGILTELPCKVGDKVYRIAGTPKRRVIKEKICSSIEFNSFGILIHTYGARDILNDKIFLSKNKAEIRIKEEKWIKK